MFQTAAGYLGWEPDVIWNTPIPQLELALEGRQEWVVLSNGGDLTKYRMQRDKEKARRGLPVIKTPPRSEVAAKLRKWLGGDTNGKR